MKPGLQATDCGCGGDGVNTARAEEANRAEAERRRSPRPRSRDLERAQAGGRALWFHPTIGAAVAAGLPWLSFSCQTCGQLGSVDLRTLEGSILSLIPALSCRTHPKSFEVDGRTAATGRLLLPSHTCLRTSIIAGTNRRAGRWDAIFGVGKFRILDLGRMATSGRV